MIDRRLLSARHWRGQKAANREALQKLDGDLGNFVTSILTPPATGKSRLNLTRWCMGCTAATTRGIERPAWDVTLGGIV